MLSKECSRCPVSTKAHTSTHVLLANRSSAHRRVLKCAAGDKQQQQQHSSDQDSWPQQQQLRTAVLATAVCVAFVSNVSEARASDNWIPRRHHRHIGERFTDTWADSIVEVGHRVLF